MTPSDSVGKLCDYEVSSTQTVPSSYYWDIITKIFSWHKSVQQQLSIFLKLFLWVVGSGKTSLGSTGTRIHTHTGSRSQISTVQYILPYTLRSIMHPPVRRTLQNNTSSTCTTRVRLDPWQATSNLDAIMGTAGTQLLNYNTTESASVHTISTHNITHRWEVSMHQSTGQYSRHNWTKCSTG